MGIQPVNDGNVDGNAKGDADTNVRLVVASRNAGKMRELRALLSDLPVALISAEEAGLPDIEETGRTFRENALLKAREARRWSGCPALGEDSGIEVDALAGEPGVRSSRFAGPDATDHDRNRILLERLGDAPMETRSCRYRSVVAMVFPDGVEIVTEGACEGSVALSPKGRNGFGYDPIFLLPDGDRTMAEIAPEEKNRISHRGKALAAMKRELTERLR